MGIETSSAGQRRAAKRRRKAEIALKVQNGPVITTKADGTVIVTPNRHKPSTPIQIIEPVVETFKAFVPDPDIQTAITKFMSTQTPGYVRNTRKHYTERRTHERNQMIKNMIERDNRNK